MFNSRTITYSPAYTLVPTYECFNRCSYCNFRANPGETPWLTLENGRTRLTELQDGGVCEILILSGEVHPQSSQRQAWFERIYDLCQLALSLGFLPHTNAGILSFAEMRSLGQVNVSMGLMLEQLTPHLQDTVHRYAPSKVPEVRLQQLAWAGELKIPFTTGLLLGIGESPEDWWETLAAIAEIHSHYGHIQEVILQPYSPGSKETGNAPGFDIYKLPDLITGACQILPPDITLQIPPNLIPDSQLLLACLVAGARDLGGIGPKDEVNPDYPHLNQGKLKEILQSAGWQLLPRLPVYPQYVSWLSSRLQEAVKRYQHSADIKLLCSYCNRQGSWDILNSSNP